MTNRQRRTRQRQRTARNAAKRDRNAKKQAHILAVQKHHRARMGREKQTQRIAGLAAILAEIMRSNAESRVKVAA